MLAGSFCILILSFQNCGVTRPAVEKMEFASVAFYHTGLEVSCNSCHSESRPNSSNGFTAFNAKTTFNLATHGLNQDCFLCHDSGKMFLGQRRMVDWAGGFFNHDESLTSCNECHSAPAVIPPSNQPHPSFLESDQCLSCHSQAISRIALETPQTYFSLNTELWKGAAPGLVYGANSIRNIRTFIANYNPLTASANPGIFNSWTATPQNVIMFMNHNSTTIPTSMQTNCLSCHSADTVSFKNGAFHSSIRNATLAQPTTCVDCHGANIPENSIGASLPVAKSPGTTAFVGSGPRSNTTTAIFNHASTFGKTECATCHVQSSWNTPAWTGAQFHTRVSVQPTTCTECHSAARPSGTVTDGSVSINHSEAGMGECVGCHQASVTGLFANWRGGIARPSGLSGGSTKINPIVTQLLKTGTVVTGRTASAAVTIPLLMDHNEVGFLTGPTVNVEQCSTCHSGSAYVGGKFHSKIGTSSPRNCTSCHSNITTALPGKVVGWDKLKPIDHGHISVVGSNCTSCHTQPTTIPRLFADGSLHQKLSTQPTTCLNCHAVKIVDNKIQNGVDHTSFLNRDCNSCHDFPGLGGTVTAPTWKGARGAPATYTIPSHVSNGITIAGFTGTHTQTNTNCTSCHGTDTTYKTIMDFDHQGLPAGQNSCLSCHLGNKTDMTAYMASNTRATVKSIGDRHHGSSYFNGKSLSCVGCHTLSSGVNTFTNSNGIIFPSSAKTAYVNIGCGSVSSSALSCHEDGQRRMTIPTSTSGSGSWTPP